MALREASPLERSGAEQRGAKRAASTWAFMVHAKEKEAASLEIAGENT